MQKYNKENSGETQNRTGDTRIFSVPEVTPLFHSEPQDSATERLITRRTARDCVILCRLVTSPYHGEPVFHICRLQHRDINMTCAFPARSTGFCGLLAAEA